MKVNLLHGPDSQKQFRPLFQPHTIAVIGASATGTSAGNRFIRVLKEAGFPGLIFPIHPTAAEIEGLPAFRSLTDTPNPVDYAYLTVPARVATSVLEKAAGRLRFAQVMASGDPETHHEWEQQLCDIARKGGIRLIGPNCMGTHSPYGRYTFMEGVITEPGNIGIACQSGGLGMDILRRGQHLGLRFSGLVTLGNSVDVGPADLLEYYLEDPKTSVVGLYIEDIKDGARFQKLARRNRGRKPIVLLVGGITGQGGRAAASHTGAMAGSDRAWRALARQTGMILAETLDTFLDALQLCVWLRPKPRREPTITLVGNGGGTSVLATDALDRAGFSLAAPPPAARAAYDEIKLPPGASLANPIDIPASVLKEEDGGVAARILKINQTMTAPYATIVHLNLPVIMGYRHVEGFFSNLMNSVLSGDASQDEAPHQILVLRSDRSDDADAWRREFRKAAADRGVPSFDEIPQAVSALAEYGAYERFLSATGHVIPATISRNDV